MDLALMHAIALFAIPATVIVVLACTGVTRPRKSERLKGAIWIIVLSVLYGFFTVAIPPSSPLLNWAIPSLAALVVYTFTRLRRVGLIAAVAYGLICVVLVEHTENLHPGYERFQEANRRWWYRSETALARARSVLIARLKDDPQLTLPEGWLDEPGALSPQATEDELLLLRRPALQMHWYSQIVGFAKHDPTRELAIWSPGGTVDDVKDKLELRVRNRVP